MGLPAWVCLQAWCPASWEGKASLRVYSVAVLCPPGCVFIFLFSSVLGSVRSSGLPCVLWILLGYYVVCIWRLAYREGNILLGVYMHLVEYVTG